MQRISWLWLRLATGRLESSASPIWVAQQLATTTINSHWWITRANSAVVAYNHQSNQSSKCRWGKQLWSRRRGSCAEKHSLVATMLVGIALPRLPIYLSRWAITAVNKTDLLILPRWISRLRQLLCIKISTKTTELPPSKRKDFWMPKTTVMEGNIRFSSIRTLVWGLLYTTRLTLSIGILDQTTLTCHFSQTDTTTVQITIVKWCNSPTVTLVKIMSRVNTTWVLKGKRPLTRHSIILESQPRSRNEASSIFMTLTDSEKN